jgi:hypothetical protein
MTVPSECFPRGKAVKKQGVHGKESRSHIASLTQHYTNERN